MTPNNKIETPIWGALDDVYEPSEDSFLLLDALEQDLEFIRSSKPGIVMEIGSGSGVIITALSKVLGAFNLAVDISSKACLASKDTANKNSAQVDVVQMDLNSALRSDHLIDLLIFNPPYVVTTSEEITGTLARAWAGGHKGREVTDRLLYHLPQIMSQKSMGYIVAIDENIPEEMCKILTKLGFETKTIALRKVPGEKLSIIRFSKGIEYS